MEEFAGNFSRYNFALLLAEDDNNEGENEIAFETVVIIEEDSIENLGNEKDGQNFKLHSDCIDKEISIVVKND